MYHIAQKYETKKMRSFNFILLRIERRPPLLNFSGGTPLSYSRNIGFLRGQNRELLHQWLTNSDYSVTYPGSESLLLRHTF
jgi:hypothetical protein